MKKNQRHRRLVLLIFIPPLLAICLCVVLLTPSVYNFLNSAAFPDYLWSQHITRELNEKGYSIHDIVNVSRSEGPSISIVAVGVRDLVNGEQRKPYELVKDVHLIIMKAYVGTSPQHQPVDIIFVIVDNYPSVSYAVEIDFKDVQEFQAGKISEQDYLSRWVLHPDTLEIDPP